MLVLSCGGKERIDDPLLRLRYVNKKYMFKIEFPEKWLNYADFERTEIIDPPLSIQTIYFALPTRSREWQAVNTPAGFAEIFYVRVFTREQWKLYNEKYRESDGQRFSDMFPGEGKDFVYMIRFAESLPVDLFLYMKESVEVTSTFRMLKSD